MLAGLFGITACFSSTMLFVFIFSQPETFLWKKWHYQWKTSQQPTHYYDRKTGKVKRKWW